MNRIACTLRHSLGLSATVRRATPLVSCGSGKVAQAACAVRHASSIRTPDARVATPASPQVSAPQHSLGAVSACSGSTAARGYGSYSGHHLGHAGHGSSFGETIYGTTILCVRKGNQVAVVGDGQVTQGSMVMKPNATKVRRLGDGVIAGFAGATADALTLFERLEAKLEEHPGQLARACVQLAKEWRTEKYLRRLEAIMLVCDKEVSLTLTGVGDVFEPAKDGIIAIGSGGGFAHAAAKALVEMPELTAMEVAEKSMLIAAEMCVYTNANFTKDSLTIDE